MLGSVGSWLNMGFLGVVVCNTLIGIAQQLRAKKTIDELTLGLRPQGALSAGRPVGILPVGGAGAGRRGGLRAGDQIVADAVVLEGQAQVNESLITGRGAGGAQRARGGAALRQFPGSGALYGPADPGGGGELRQQADGSRPGGRPQGGQGRDDALAGQADPGHRAGAGPGGGWRCSGSSTGCWRWICAARWRGTVAALIGMIPEGLYLLTSVALAIGMLRLARRRVLTQDMNCIETLARVDVLCMDKTGTITESAMEAQEPILLGGCLRGGRGADSCQLLLRRGAGQRHRAGAAGAVRRGRQTLAGDGTGSLPDGLQVQRQVLRQGGGLPGGRPRHSGGQPPVGIPGPAGADAGSGAPGAAAGPAAGGRCPTPQSPWTRRSWISSPCCRWKTASGPPPPTPSAILRSRGWR